MAETFQYFLPKKETPREDQLVLSAWIVERAKRVAVTHNHSTTFEGETRKSSWLGKLSLQNNPELPLPDEISSIVDAIYEVNRQVAEAVLDMELRRLPTRHASVAHVKWPGDEPGESHLDIFPTSPNYLDGDGDTNGGMLFIGGNPWDAPRRGHCTGNRLILPTPGTALVFGGANHVHIAAELPESATKPRVSVNNAFMPPDEVLRTLDPTHPRMVELLKVYQIPEPLHY